MAFVSFMRQAEICRLNSRSPLQSRAADAAAVPHKPSGRQDLRQFLEPGPQVSKSFDDVHGGEAFHLAGTFQFVHETAAGPSPRARSASS